MVNFFPDFVKCAPNATLSDVAGESISSLLDSSVYRIVKMCTNAVLGGIFFQWTLGAEEEVIQAVLQIVHD